MDRELEQLLALSDEYVEDDGFGTDVAEEDDLEFGPDDAELVDDADGGGVTDSVDADLDYDDDVDDDDYDEDEDYDVEEDDEDY